MGNYDDEDYVYCKNCEKEILQEEATYVAGKPYCKKCYRDAEIYEIHGEYYEEEDNEEDEDDDDDDNDYD